MWYTAGNDGNLNRCVVEGDCDSGVELIDDKNSEEDAIKLVTHPLVSPYYANLKGLPALLVVNYYYIDSNYKQAGGVELIREETIEISKKLRDSNPDHASYYRHELYKDMPHVFQTFFWTETSKIAMKRAGQWCKSIWDKKQPHSIRFEESKLVESTYGVDRFSKPEFKMVEVEESAIIPTDQHLEVNDLVYHPFF